MAVRRDLHRVQAVEILGRHEAGFVLFVEAAHVDKAHHENWAAKALEEVLELEQAVAAAQQLTEAADTLLLVTADHSHALTISGYPRRGRGADILGGDTAPGSQQTSDAHGEVTTRRHLKCNSPSGCHSVS